MTTDRELSSCSHDRLKDNCRLCGVYFPQTIAYKTNRFCTEFSSSTQQYLKHLRKTSTPTFGTIPDVSESTSCLLEAICVKFEFGYETLALGMYFYAEMQQQKLKKLKEKKLNGFSIAEENFLASSCLLVASKAIELDRKVPYLNRYQRYAEKSKTKEDYEDQ